MKTDVIESNNKPLTMEEEMKDYRFARDFFFNALYDETKDMFGEQFDDFSSVGTTCPKTGFNVNYDIIMSNEETVCLVEVVYEVDTREVTYLLKKEAQFRAYFPEFQNKKLYLAIASTSFDKHVEDECKKQGIAMIKKVGDTIEIYDEHLKVF